MDTLTLIKSKPPKDLMINPRAESLETKTPLGFNDKPLGYVLAIKFFLPFIFSFQD